MSARGAGATQNAPKPAADVTLPAETQAAIEELRAHMEAEGEKGSSAQAAAEIDGGFVFEQCMKLVRLPASGQWYAVPSDADWMHDQLGEGTCVIPGVLYAADEPFRAGSCAVDGYFQADEDGRWVRMRDGMALTDAGAAEPAWVGGLEEFPEVVAQLAECMEVSEYRHVAEQAVMKSFISNR